MGRKLAQQTTKGSSESVGAAPFNVVGMLFSVLSNGVDTIEERKIVVPNCIFEPRLARQNIFGVQFQKSTNDIGIVAEIRVPVLAVTSRNARQ